LNIVVVGGGTAGWIAALYSKKNFPKDNVTLIESSEIGILGAGEGTTPQLVFLLEYLGISVFDMINKTDSTIKNSIKFVDWGKDSFHHSFADIFKINKYNYPNFLNDFNFPAIDYAYPYCQKNNKNVDDYFISTVLSEEKKVFLDNVSENLTSWSIHFNAKKMAQYLKEIALSRGIGLIDDEVVDFKQDGQGYLYEIVLKNHSAIECDFVFDSSGFKRIIIGKLFESKWKSHKEHLPVNKAIPFFLPETNDPEPYTTATAMKYGWMWKIPVQERYGCGYVFDSNFIDEGEAKKEVENKLKFEVDVARSIDFDAGVYQKIWIKNCLAIGLSSGFIEPLEATSLWQMVRVLLRFFSSPQNIYEKNDSVKDLFNNKYLKDTQNVVDFLYLHYTTNKKENNFWKNFNTNNTVPEKIEELLKILKYEIPNVIDFFNDEIFGYSDYMTVIFGNNLVSQKVIRKYTIDEQKTEHLEKRKIEIKKQMQEFPNHKKFLETIRKKYEK